MHQGSGFRPSISRLSTFSFDPFDVRDEEHTTSDYGAFAHMIKGCLGAGLLAMPLAFHHSGWVFGVVATILVGLACTFCMNLLVLTVWQELKIKKVAVLTYSDAAEASFLSGPQWAKKCAKAARIITEAFLIIQLLGICSVYVLFVANAIQEVLDYFEVDIDKRLTILGLIPVLIPMCLIKTLKFLAPLSILANICMCVAMGIIFYYFFEDYKDIDDRTMMNTDYIHIPIFFGIVVFSLEGVGVVISIENSMTNPRHFIYGPSILNLAMILVTLTYCFTGFFGYLRYGDTVDDNITTNVPFQGAGLGAKILMSLGILMSLCIQFYPPIEIMWNKMKDKIAPKHSTLYNVLLRLSLMLVVVLAAIIIPNLGILMSIMGSLCLSVLGFVFPPLMEYCTFYEKYRHGCCGHRLLRTIFFNLFGVFAMFSGLYSNIYALIYLREQETEPEPEE